MTSPRFAVYFAPAEGPLWRFGSMVLGYDARRGCSIPPLTPEGFSGELWAQCVAEPARYGFHATLKAPFRLAEGVTRSDLTRAVDAVAARHRSVLLPKLEVAAMDRYVALVPSGETSAVDELAFAIVETLDHLRAPLSPGERERRLSASSLTPRQRAHLETYGYPFVGADFRFHMSLAGPISAEHRAAVLTGLSALYMDRMSPAPVSVDRLCIFEQPSADRPFRVVHESLLGRAR